MTRFGLSQKALINYRRACKPYPAPRNVAESGDGRPELRPCRRLASQGTAVESPHAKRAAAAECGFFNDYRAGLLIVPALFSIQRRNGEVAEWSKALPC
ncbi:hypothetical protein [Mesorhizobium sp. M0847]|uniref:hypothetical protein n=1 Tax=unclassified Mesorhizobium TaxID=325217 RepID=UPI00333B9CA5